MSCPSQAPQQGGGDHSGECGSGHGQAAAESRAFQAAPTKVKQLFSNSPETLLL